uniref:CLUMA_CG014321, isoform A n=1 Tax=Clunio marinus TaxID=568069 RepID=A0A1J1ILD9_9DIPT|nr:CLUMA_CG014321, isoform A [Clunio marinus]
MNKLQRQKALLTEEIKNIKIVNENSESEAVVSLQKSMKGSVMELEKKFSDLNEIINEKTTEITSLTKTNSEILEKVSELEKETVLMTNDRDTCRTKIDSLKNEKRDDEKTLEQEVREKNESKTQVTNIFQEIGRLDSV